MAGRDEQFAAMAKQMGAQAVELERHQDMMRRAIEEAMTRPSQVHEILISGTGVVELQPGQRALVIALPTGEQLRVRLDRHTCVTLAKALGAPFKQSIETPAQELNDDA